MFNILDVLLFCFIEIEGIILLIVCVGEYLIFDEVQDVYNLLVFMYEG